MVVHPLSFLIRRQAVAGRPRPCARQGAEAEDVTGDRAPLREGATGGSRRGGGERAIAHRDHNREATAAGGRGSGGCVGACHLRSPPRAQVLTQKVHLAPNTQQAEKLASHAQRVEMTCQSIFPEN
jgi:hypothetical protein